MNIDVVTELILQKEAKSLCKILQLSHGEPNFMRDTFIRKKRLSLFLKPADENSVIKTMLCKEVASVVLWVS